MLAALADRDEHTNGIWGVYVLVQMRSALQNHLAILKLLLVAADRSSPDPEQALGLGRACIWGTAWLMKTWPHVRVFFRSAVVWFSQLKGFRVLGF